MRFKLRDQTYPCSLTSSTLVDECHLNRLNKMEYRGIVLHLIEVSNKKKIGYPKQIL